ncbi:TonB-dependent hemoglobin/transferrin/lactoferrin family receptor [Vacuolonema iberomarrocanum]|uniref:TonB-dependent hemoglobin/transferrin/lactoferrin family receptor n=1 Tax=Vacuolonema iberomarrocanum TaxID=3454632 RepID=UPI001A02F44B|nr:TonB-dependent hemoglobin/transferrin/lactoferrin family receptor [filamentous cyanobacterium LEGE 07170]
MAQAETALIEVTGVNVNTTAAGLEVVLETSETVPTPVTTTEGNALVIEIPAAVLALPEGEEFLDVGPAEGIAAITANNMAVAGEPNQVRIVITGTDAPPTAEVTSTAQQMVLNVAIAPPGTSAGAIDDSRIQITVTGTRNPDDVQDAPSNITVIDREEIERIQAQDIRDLVRFEPGIVVRDNARYGLQDFNIRGLDGNRVLLQVDGIRIPTRFEFGPFALGRDYVDLDSLSAVEIIRGPASALYGSDALAGVVSYFSLDPEALLDEAGRDFVGGVRLGYGSENTSTNINTAFAARLGDLDVLFGYTRRDGNELQVSGDDRFVDPETNNRNNFLGSAVYRLSDTQSLRLITEVFDDDAELDILEANLVAPNVQFEDVELNTNRERISLSYEYDDPDSNSFLQFGRFQVYYQNARNEELRIRQFTYGPTSGGQFPIGTPVRRNDDYDFLDRVWGANLQLRSDFDIGAVENRLTYGIEVSTTRNERPRDRVETSLVTGESTRISSTDTFPIEDFPPSDTVRLGFYIQDEITFGDGRFTLIPGLRFDIYDLTVEDSPSFERNDVEPVDFNDSDVSPSLALIFRPSDEITLVGRYARGFRAPLYSEINSGFTNTTGAFFKYRTIPNPDLESETSNTFELGIRGDFDRFRFGLTGFYSRYDNFIEEFVDAGTEIITPPPAFGTPVINIFQTQNITEAEIYGLELGSEYRFSSGEDGFRVRLALAWTEGNNLTDDEPLESVSPFQLVAGLGYRAPGDRWGVEFIGTVVGEPDVNDIINDQERFIPDAYTVFDLIGYINLSPNVSLNLGVYNIFNTEYYQFADVRNVTADRPDIGRFSQARTSFRAGLTWRF